MRENCGDEGKCYNQLQIFHRRSNHTEQAIPRRAREHLHC
jgi:hypothetical protein